MIDSSFNKVYFETGICQFLQIEGISNFTVNKTTSFDNPYVIGGQISASQVNSPTKIDVSFDRSFIQKDFIFNYIQNNPLRSIYIQQENCYYKISNLYLTSYSASFGVGELPKISSKFSSYYNSFEERDSLEGTNLNLYTYQLDIPKLNSIILTDMSNTIVDDTRNPLIKNQIVSNFDFSMTMKRQPYYTIGCKLPNEVVSSFPNDVNFSITTKKLQYSLKEIDNTMDDIAPCCNLNFNIYISGCELMKFPITNSKLVSRENTFQSCSLMNIRKNYIGYYDLN
jgi:hypothetical protein